MRTRNPLRRDYAWLRRSFLCVALATLAACAGNEQRALDLAAQAQVEAEAGRLADARKTIEEAIRERDDLAQLYMQKGRIELVANSYRSAFAAYSEAIALDATNFEALQAIARLGLVLGYKAEARDAADRLLVLQPADPDALFVSGLLALDARKPDEAADFARRILQRNPSDERGLIVKARTQYFTGDSDAALATLKERPAAGPPGEATVLTLLELHRARSEAAGMLEQFARLRVLKPADPRLRVDEANLLYKVGEMTRARVLLRDVMTAPVVPTDVRTRVLALWGAYDTSTDALEAPNVVPMRDDNARRAVARHLLVSDSPRKAREILGTARSLADKGLEARIAIAEGRTAEGLSAARKILADDKTQCDALLASASAQISARDQTGAVIAAQRAVAECPDDPGAYLHLAASHRAQKNTSAEFRALDAGLTAMPHDLTIATAYFNRAAETGDPALALGVARRMTRAAPAVSDGWSMLARACALVRDDACARQAQAGLAKSKTNYVLDPLPGELRTGSVLGRLQQ